MQRLIMRRQHPAADLKSRFTSARRTATAAMLALSLACGRKETEPWATFTAVDHLSDRWALLQAARSYASAPGGSSTSPEAAGAAFIRILQSTPPKYAVDSVLATAATVTLDLSSVHMVANDPDTLVRLITGQFYHVDFEGIATAAKTRATTLVRQGKYSEAEAIGHQLIAFGVLLADASYTWEDAAAGAQEAEAGLAILRFTFDTSGREREATRIDSLKAAAARTLLPVVGSVPTGAAARAGWLRRNIKRNDLPRGIRWHLLIVTAPAIRCELPAENDRRALAADFAPLVVRHRSDSYLLNRLLLDEQTLRVSGSRNPC
jgi:hypothetical protein